MGSRFGHSIDYNGVRALRGQRHIPSKNSPNTAPCLSYQMLRMQGYSDLNSLLKLLCIRTNLMSVELVNKRYTFHYCQEITVTYMLVLIR